MFKLISTILSLICILLTSCKKNSTHNDTIEPETQAEDHLEVRIELVPDIKLGEENMTEEDRMLKRYNETKTVITPSKEALEQMSDPANWKEITKEDLKSLDIIDDTDSEKLLKIIIEKSYQTEKLKK